MTNNSELTLGNFGVYQKIMAGISPYNSFLVEINGEYYAVKDVKVYAGKGVVLTVNNVPRHYGKETV